MNPDKKLSLDDVKSLLSYKTIYGLQPAFYSLGGVHKSPYCQFIPKEEGFDPYPLTDHENRKLINKLTYIQAYRFLDYLLTGKDVSSTHSPALEIEETQTASINDSLSIDLFSIKTSISVGLDITTNNYIVDVVRSITYIPKGICIDVQEYIPGSYINTIIEPHYNQDMEDTINAILGVADFNNYPTVIKAIIPLPSNYPRFINFLYRLGEYDNHPVYAVVNINRHTYETISVYKSDFGKEILTLIDTPPDNAFNDELKSGCYKISFIRKSKIVWEKTDSVYAHIHEPIVLLLLQITIQNHHLSLCS